MKESLKQLVIDTATKYIFLSLLIDNEEKFSIYEEGINNHSVTIMPYLEKILKQENINLQDIDEVIIGVGPGSYTGVRIGVTVAKMIGFLNRIRVFKVSSLALMATASDQEYVLPLIDARRGNAFMGLYRQSSGKIERVIDDRLANIEAFKAEIKQEYQVITSGKPDLGKILKSQLLEPVDEIEKLIPNYLRQTEAERNLHKDR